MTVPPTRSVTRLDKINFQYCSPHQLLPLSTHERLNQQYLLTRSLRVDDHETDIWSSFFHKVADLFCRLHLYLSLPSCGSLIPSPLSHNAPVGQSPSQQGSKGSCAASTILHNLKTFDRLRHHKTKCPGHSEESSNRFSDDCSRCVRLELNPPCLALLPW